MSYVIPDPRFEMPELLIPGRKPTGNVVIDWSHPLTRGLEKAFIFTTQGAAVELVRGEVGSVTHSGNEPDGFLFSAGGSDIATFDGLTPSSPSTEFTFTFGLNRDETASTGVILTTTTGDIKLEFGSGGTIQPNWATGSLTITPTNRIDDGVNHHNCLTGIVPSGSASDIKLYTDGKLNGSFTTTTYGTDDPSASNLLLGNRSSYWKVLAGTLGYLWIHSVENHDNAAELSRNPYQFLIPA